MSHSFEVYAVQPESGAPLRTLLPEEGTARFDPFLAIHEQGPVVYKPRRAIGFPEHPHRGIETITYVVAGEQYHRDSFGHEGILLSGDVQWMSAAAGIIHSELPSEALYERGGPVHAFQIWLNLPKARKMDEPRYQDVRSDDLPRLTQGGASVRLVAGELDGRRSPIDCARPFLMAHARFEPAASRTFSVPAGSTLVLCGIAGAGTVDGAPIGASTTLIGRDRRSVEVTGSSAGLEVLILAAEPLGEPVVSRGPFVMTSEAEIEQAYQDLVEGRFGRPSRSH